jgi:hypothetical protein
VIVFLGDTTWANDGVWSPDGAYSRFVSLTIAVVWISIVSGLLYLRTPAARQVSEAAGIPSSVTSWRDPPAALVLSPNSEECER